MQIKGLNKTIGFLGLDLTGFKKPVRSPTWKS